MPGNIINTVFPVYQGFDSVPATVAPPYSPGAGENEVHPAGEEGNVLAPGRGLPTEVRASNLTQIP